VPGPDTTGDGGRAPGTTGSTGSTGGDPEAPCLDACDAQNPAGSKVYAQVDSQWATCVCAANACATQCGTSYACSADPNAPDPSDACLSCADANQNCNQQADTACNGDPSCAALTDCYDACDKAAGQ
jgi:hypothetical protein